MDIGSFQNSGSEGLTGLSSSLLKAALDHLPVCILILKPVWEDDRITDFILVFANKTSENHAVSQFAIGKNFYTRNRLLANTMIRTIEHGTTQYLNDTYIFSENEQLKVTVIKIQDAVLLLYAPDINQQQGEQIRTGQDILRQSDAKLIDDLNKTLKRKNSDLEELNAGLRALNTITAHDYKETIRMLYTSLEYIITKEARKLSDNSKGNIRRAQSAIQRIKLLTDDINTYLQLYDTGINKSIIDPNMILKTVIAGLKSKMEQANARVDAITLPLLPVDPYLFSRLMTHLLDNALKFRKLIAPLQIKIKYTKADELNTIPSALRDTPYIIISVSDNGIGFEEEDAGRIFEPFLHLHAKTKYQYKDPGIGLAVCRKIMTMHDGFITAEISPALGATINCYFPIPRTTVCSG